MVVFSEASGGAIVEPGCVVPFDLAGSGYVEQEFLVSGDARGYERGADAPAADRPAAAGPAPSGSAAFRTRIVVRRPADAARFSGTVLVEWLNVSSGFDADPDWAYLHEEILRQGHAWAGVSAQALGVNGGHSLLGFTGPFPGLRGSDPARYGTLDHPGDRYSFDIFRQVGRELRSAGHALGGLVPAAVLAVGESQSAFYLVGYINEVHPLDPVFDGFLVHSRGAGAAPLDGAGLNPTAAPVGVRIRTDLAVPVLVLESESDILAPLSGWLARQPDSELFALWEVPGTAHADAYLLGEAAKLLGCDWRTNEGPHRFVCQAGLHALERWVRDRVAPPRAPRIELTAQQPPAIARDAHGNALGGVRTPAVDVPAATLTGEGPPGTSGPPGTTAPGWLVGSTIPLDDAALLHRYGDRAGYLAAYTQSLDAVIEAGFLLPAHRAQLLAQADAVPFPEIAPA